MNSAFRRWLVWVGVFYLWGTGCAGKSPSFDVAFQSGDGRHFVSRTIDFGESQEVYRWGGLTLDIDLKDQAGLLEAEYCLTNNSSPRLGNYYTYTFSPDRMGTYMDFSSQFVDQRVVMSHDNKGEVRANPSFNWPDKWESEKYHVLFDFKQAFTLTKVEVSVASYYPNQFLPHILVYAGSAGEQGLKQVGEGFLPEEAKKKLDEKMGYGGHYLIEATLGRSASSVRFLKVVFDKPQIGISHVLVPYVRVWGKLERLSQVAAIRIKAVSASGAEEIEGPPDRIFKEAAWFDYGQPIPCPENRFVRFLVKVDPLYDPVFSVESVSGKITPLLL